MTVLSATAVATFNLATSTLCFGLAAEKLKDAGLPPIAQERVISCAQDFTEALLNVDLDDKRVQVYCKQAMRSLRTIARLNDSSAVLTKIARNTLKTAAEYNI